MKLPVLLYTAVNARQRRKKENIHCAVFHSLQFWCDLEKWSQLPTEYEPLMLHTGYNKRNFTLLRISLQLCLKRYHHFVKMWKYLSLTEFQIYRNIFPQRMTTSALIPLIPPPPRFPPTLQKWLPVNETGQSTQRPWQHFTCKSVTSACILVKRSFRTLDRLVWKLPLSAWNCDVLNLLQASWMTAAPGWTSTQLDCGEKQLTCGLHND